MNEAIKLAIEKGGWKHRLVETWTDSQWSPDRVKVFIDSFWPEIVLDLLFWQSLGKALGWSERETKGHYLYYFDELFEGNDMDNVWKAFLERPKL